MNYAFCCFAPDWAIGAVMKILAVLLKYPTFEGFFFIFMEKTTRKLEFLYIVADSEKTVNFCLKCTFWGQNSLKHIK